MREVNPTMLVELGTLAASKSKVTEDTKEAVAHSLDYCSTSPYSKLSHMTFLINSYASYLS